MLRFGIFLLLALPCFAESQHENEQAIGQLLSQWTQAQSASDSTALYHGTVDYYGETLKLAQLTQRRAVFFRQHPDFVQKIATPWQISWPDAALDRKVFSSAEVRFIKQVGFGSLQSNYPARLKLAKTTLGWKIAAEQDDITALIQARKAGKKIAGNVLEGRFADNNDYAWITASDEKTGGICEPELAECICTLWSRDIRIKPVPVTTCMDATGSRLADLRQRGSDVLQIEIARIMGGQVPYYLYDIQHGQWVLLSPPIISQVDALENGVQPIRALVGQPGKVMIEESAYVNGKLLSKKKIISLKSVLN